MNMDFDNFLNTIMDLKYSQRLNRYSFAKLFYPNATDEDFLNGQWYLFRNAPLRYIWANLTNEQIALLYDYINNEKGGDE